RHVGDADLLIDQRDLPRLRMILVGLNWQRVPFCASFDTTSELYTKNSENFMLDIHTNPVEDRFASKIRTEEVLDFSERNALAPMPYKLPFPSREDMLLLLCVHGMKHLWCRLLWVFDIVCALEQKDDFNWDLVLKKSSEMACLRQVLCGMKIAELLSGRVVPGCVSKAISKDARVQEVAKELVSLIFERRAGVVASLHNILLHMKLQDSHLWALKVPIYRALSRIIRCLMTCQ
ncbi:MAG: nucleotidyltransferase family protein, partial [SAR324 cluster bacterium]|nr:nucleotidyltransferase family protein [SAR324 cluster bacterium]